MTNMPTRVNDIGRALNKSLREVAQIVDGRIVGDENLVIRGLCGIKEAREGDLTFLANSKYSPLAETTKASAIITSKDITISGKTVLQTNDPSLAFAKIVSVVYDDQTQPLKGIHPTAIIADDATIGKNVYIGPYVVIENRASVGDNTVIHSGTYIGRRAILGKGCLVYPNATLRERIFIGDRVIIHSGTVIGADGFGFADVAGAHEKIPQIGTVVIEDDVEIGANVTIDRARFDKTKIGRGTKIDNLVQIAHNVLIGENCIVVAQTGISGSVIVEKGAILAGQSGIAGHLTIGEGAVVAAQAGVTKSVPAHTKVSGYPAKPHEMAKRVNASLQRLPQYIKTINELKKKIEALEEKINEAILLEGIERKKTPSEIG